MYDWISKHQLLDMCDIHLLPIVEALQGEEFPNIPHRQLQMLHVRQLPEASGHLQPSGMHGLCLDQNITQSPTHLTHCSTNGSFFKLFLAGAFIINWKDLLEAKLTCVWPQAFGITCSSHKSLRTSHAGLAITSTGQRREHTPQLTRLQQDGCLPQAFSPDQF